MRLRRITASVVATGVLALGLAAPAGANPWPTPEPGSPEYRDSREILDTATSELSSYTSSNYEAIIRDIFFPPTDGRTPSWAQASMLGLIASGALYEVTQGLFGSSGVNLR
ncbi:hypothetical protein M0E84_07125 [Corynebacterium sp. CCM 9186]|uniref:hypothetical protein n=1 Tax=Corynebacterium meridianum TaxID=2765363 RepID=UPI00200599D0|nr:hypothetical protein [Corynebacterium meridianum]MCK7677802.1 hypothetical protein [Corynebacterium meridianum]